MSNDTVFETKCVNCHKKIRYDMMSFSKPDDERPPCEHCGLNPMVPSKDAPWTKERAMPFIVVGLIFAFCIVFGIVSAMTSTTSSTSSSGPGVAPVYVPSSSYSSSPSSRSGSYGSRYRSSGGPSRGK